MKRWIVTGLTLALAGVVLSGCAGMGPQPQEVSQAEMAIEKARAEGAAENCPEEFNDVLQMWHEVQDLCPCNPEEAKEKAVVVQKRAGQLCSDDDGDGVPNDRDLCPDTPAGVEVDKDGCALDDDGDGVLNANDRCPTTPVGVEVDAYGCAVGPDDSDKDGVNDKYDRCPNTPEGAKVDAMGCWVIGKVYFDLDKHAIKPRYTDLLDEVAKVMKWNPEVTMNLKGHTDALASEAYNQTLSQQRAIAVKQYLVEVGVSAGRFQTQAFGENRPTAPNATPEQRALNRRVELVPDW